MMTDAGTMSVPNAATMINPQITILTANSVIALVGEVLVPK
jgi:hypothetical protein